MAWQQPKTNWQTSDGVFNTDLNRIEGNIIELGSAANLDKADYLRNPGFSRTIGTSTAYVINLDPPPAKYKEGDTFTIVPHVQSSGSNVTLNVNNLGAIPIVKSNGALLTDGYLKAGIPITLVRVGNNFFVNSGGGIRLGDRIYIMDTSEHRGTIKGFNVPAYGSYPRMVGINDLVLFIGNAYMRRSSIYDIDTSSSVNMVETPLFLMKSLAGYPYIVWKSNMLLQVVNSESYKDTKWKISQKDEIVGREGYICTSPDLSTIISSSGGHISKINASTGDVAWTVPIPGGSDYNGYVPVTLDSNNNIFAANFPDGTIRRYTPSGVLNWQIGIVEEAQITMLAFDVIHDFLVVTTWNHIYIYGGTSGNYYYTLPLGRSYKWGSLDIDETGNILTHHADDIRAVLSVYTEGQQPIPYRQVELRAGEGNKPRYAKFMDRFGKLALSYDNAVEVHTYATVINN